MKLLIKQVFLVLVLMIVSISTLLCQEADEYEVYDDELIRKGITLGIGFGVGHSSHANAYEERDMFSYHKFGGLRGIVLDGKIGWRLSDSFEVYSNLQFSPSNTTISPYRSIFLGGAIAYYLKNTPQYSFHIGSGIYQSNIKKLGSTGNGNLFSGAISWQVSKNFFFDMKILTGKMDIADLDPNPFGDSEFNISFGVACKY